MPPGFAPSTSPRDASPADAGLALGLRRNWRQFSLLVVVNAFVGGMVGLERAVLPLFAERECGLASKAAILSFIVSFGAVKAVTNLAAGRWSERVGRKPLLVAGWIAGLPVPFLLMWAPAWSWVIAANVLLGVNQGLCWSTTVVMKIDLVDPHRRGLAMGLNEFAGYTAVALAAWGCALVAGAYGFRTALFAFGIVLSVVGLLLSVLFVRETSAFAQSEARSHSTEHREARSFTRVFMDTSVADRNLSACSQAGLVNNLNDGVAWGSRWCTRVPDLHRSSQSFTDVRSNPLDSTRVVETFWTRRSASCDAIRQEDAPSGCEFPDTRSCLQNRSSSSTLTLAFRVRDA